MSSKRPLESESHSEISSSFSLLARKSTCRFRVMIENFSLVPQYLNRNGLRQKNFRSTSLFLEADNSEWCLKVQYVQKTFGLNEVCFTIEKLSIPISNVKKIATFYIVNSTAQLVKKSNSIYCYKLQMENDVYLPNDTLTVVSDVEFSSLVTTEHHASKIRKLSDGSFQRCLSDFRKILASGKNSDVVLKCGDRDFKAHKSILSARSVVFSAMFDHDMKESLENEVVIEDSTPEAIEAMLRHIYGSGINKELTPNTWLQLYRDADKYDLPDLKALSSLYISSLLAVDDVCEAAVLAHLHKDERILSTAKRIFKLHQSEIVSTESWISLVSGYKGLADELLK